MLKKFSPDTCKLLYSDTDSLLYEVTCKDAYKEIIKHTPYKFDTSAYLIDNPHGMELLKVAGIMKDENNGCKMTLSVSDIKRYI